jgi:hypothetical protein
MAPIGCGNDSEPFAGSIRTADAQGRMIEIEGSCSRGEVLVFESSNRATCVDVGELDYPRCSEGAFLTTQGGSRLECMGGSSTPWGIRGLLPRCDRGDILVSEGFGRWACQEK